MAMRLLFLREQDVSRNIEFLINGIYFRTHIPIVQGVRKIAYQLPFTH